MPRRARKWTKMPRRARKWSKNAPQGPENPQNLVRLKSYLGPIEDYMSPQTRARLKGWLPE